MLTSIASDINTFHDWLADGDAGEAYEYYRGNLYADGHDKSHFAEEHRARVRAIGAKAWGSQHLVCLVQRRVSPGVCSYLAIKRRHPIPRESLPNAAEFA